MPHACFFPLSSTEELAKIRPTSTENEISLLQDISSTQLNCLESCRLLKETLLTEQEISEEKTTGGKGISYDMDSKAGVDSAVELCESSSYLQTGSVAAEEATDESEDDFGRSRTESTASRGRTQSISGVRARRNSSIFIRLPDNMGTSLIRKSADVFPNSQALNTTASADLHEQETDSPDTIAAPVEYHKASVVSFLDESVDYCQQELEDLDISKMAAGNESMYVEPVDTTKVALFEHFIVVGASEEVNILFFSLLSFCLYHFFKCSTLYRRLRLSLPTSCNAHTTRAHYRPCSRTLSEDSSAPIASVQVPPPLPPLLEYPAPTTQPQPLRWSDKRAKTRAQKSGILARIRGAVLVWAVLLLRQAQRLPPLLPPQQRPLQYVLRVCFRTFCAPRRPAQPTLVLTNRRIPPPPTPPQINHQMSWALMWSLTPSWTL